MKINLPFNSFSFFKTVTGSGFLLFVLFFPVAALVSSLVALLVGKTHALGAWFSMWRSSRLSWRYVWSAFFLMIIVSYLGFQVLEFKTLLFVTNLLFAFNFIFDEFVLGEESGGDISTILSGLNSFFLLTLILLRDNYIPDLSIMTLFAFSGMVLLLELIYLKEINWFFIQGKVLLAFVFISYLFVIDSRYILGVLLMFHYFFWFAYPVYKLHKYKRSERDGFIMLLIILLGTSFYLAITNSRFSPDVLQVGIQTFLVATIVHILSTAPFAGLLGLKPPQYSKDTHGQEK